jgi:hypothetical protein
MSIQAGSTNDTPVWVTVVPGRAVCQREVVESGKLLTPWARMYSAAWRELPLCGGTVGGSRGWVAARHQLEARILGGLEGR